MEGNSTMEGKSSFSALFLCTAFLLTTVVPVHAQLANSHWPMFQHDVRHTGQSLLDGPGALNGPPIEVKIKWKQKFNAIVRTSPAIGEDGTIYIGVGTAPICALDPDDGSVNWCTDVPGYVVTPLMSSPAVDLAGRIYMGERGNDTWSVAPDGDVLWRYSIPFDGDTLSSAVIDPGLADPDLKGTIYTGCGCVGNGTVFALDPNPPTSAGRERWRFKVGGGSTSSPAIGQDGTIYVISGPNRLHALTPGLDSATRKIGWPQTPVNIGNNTKYGSPAIGNDGTIYAPSMSGLKAINPANGAEFWSFNNIQGGVNTTPGIATATDGAILFGTTAGCFYSVRPNGLQKWENCELDGGDFLSATAIGANGISYSATTAGWVYAFHPVDGSIVWKTKIGKVQWSSPAIGPGKTLIIGSQDHNLYVFEEK